MHFLTFMRPMVLRPYFTPTGHRPACFLKGLSHKHLHSKSRLLLCCSPLVIPAIHGVGPPPLPLPTLLPLSLLPRLVPLENGFCYLRVTRTYFRV